MHDPASSALDCKVHMQAAAGLFQVWGVDIYGAVFLCLPWYLHTSNQMVECTLHMRNINCSYIWPQIKTTLFFLQYYYMNNVAIHGLYKNKNYLFLLLYKTKFCFNI